MKRFAPKRIAANLFLFAVACVLALILGEIALRAVMPEYIEFQSVLIPSELTIRKLKPNINRKLIHPANGEPAFYLTTNSLGLRSNREFSFQVPEKTKRVLFLGDSYTFGFGVEAEETYPMYLEEILNNNSGDTREYEVINAGFNNGMTTDAQYLYLRDIGMRFHPDLVIVGFCIANDLIDMFKNEWVVNEHGGLTKIFNPRDRLIPVFLRRTALFAVIKTLLLPTRVEEKNIDRLDRKMMDRVEYLLLEIRRLSKKKHFKFLFLIIPPPNLVEKKDLEGSWSEMRHELIRFCSQKDIPYLDLLMRMENDDYFVGKAHFTKNGNNKVAEMIYDKLASMDPMGTFIFLKKRTRGL